jgi:hypothetical protein
MQDQRSNLISALMRELNHERHESERLLLNILPEPIAKGCGSSETTPSVKETMA